jgi:hypothetical protein
MATGPERHRVHTVQRHDFLFPGADALALIWLISLYALVTGVLLLGFAFRLRGRAKPPVDMDRRSGPDRRMSTCHS